MFDGIPSNYALGGSLRLYHQTNNSERAQLCNKRSFKNRLVYRYSCVFFFIRIFLKIL